MSAPGAAGKAELDARARLSFAADNLANSLQLLRQPLMGGRRFH